MAARLAPDIELPVAYSPGSALRPSGWPRSPLLTLMILLASLRRSR